MTSRSRAARRSARGGYSDSSANTRLTKLPSMTSWRLKIRWFSKAWRQSCKRSRLVAGNLKHVWLCMKYLYKAVANTCPCNEDRKDHLDRVQSGGQLVAKLTAVCF